MTEIKQLTEQEIKKQALLEPVLELKDPKFVVPKGMIIPLKNMIYVSKIDSNSELLITETGLIMPEKAANTITPAIGTIVCVGYGVDDFIFPGLKITFQDVQYREVYIYGKKYLRMYDDEILGILPPKSYVYQGVYSDAYMRRTKRLKQFEDYYKRVDADLLNKHDISQEKFKKTLKKAPKKK